MINLDKSIALGIQELLNNSHPTIIALWTDGESQTEIYYHGEFNFEGIADLTHELFEMLPSLMGEFAGLDMIEDVKYPDSHTGGYFIERF